MTQTEIKIRVRPTKVAVLVADSASSDEISLAVRFLSRIWGGRYCPILPVAHRGDDPRDYERLARLRPDLVYGVSLDGAVWTQITERACQARDYAPLTRDFVESIHGWHAADLITVLPVLRSRILSPGLPTGRPIQFVRADEGFHLATFVATVFGDSDPAWGQDSIRLPPAEQPHWFRPEHGIVDYIRLCTTFLLERRRSWLDVANEGVYPLLNGSMWVPPTVVAVGAPTDLTIAWNLRTRVGSDTPAWVIPIPIDALHEQPVHEALSDWLATMDAFGIKSNFCELASSTISVMRLQAIAADMRPCLANLGIEYIDAIAPFAKTPNVHPIEYEQTQVVELANRNLTVTVPRPRLAEHMDSNGTWVVDLVREMRNGRCIGELCLPPRPCVQEVLNVPAPPALPWHGGLHRFGFGKDVINVRCKKKDEVLRHRLPTDEEVLIEVLIESGIVPLPDEKRTAYLPALDLLGGLTNAAHNFTGRLRQVIRVLMAHETANLTTILREAKLGKGKLTEELKKPDHLHNFLKHVSPIARRVAFRRFDEYWQDLYPDDTRLQTLLEHWAGQGLLVHNGPDYALEPGLRKAVGEGMVPVALTGRFFRRMTRDGFLWVPGVKYRRGVIDSDIDVLAACDGALVFAECKEMEEVAPEAGVWESQIWPQFEELIEVAKACRGDLVVLATLAESYPANWEGRARAKAGDSISVLLLTREDLDEGYRTVPQRGEMPAHRLAIDDVIVQQPAPMIPRDPPGPRTIHTPSLVVNFGG